jgi:hypothetical protein
LVLELTGLAGFCLPGVILVAVDADSYLGGGLALALIGVAAVIAAVPMIIVGYRRMRRAARPATQPTSVLSSGRLALVPGIGSTPDGGVMFGLGAAF